MQLIWDVGNVLHRKSAIYPDRFTGQASEAVVAARGKATITAPKLTPDIRTKVVRERTGNIAELEEQFNNSVAGFPIVGIGASAGGLAAFEAFFSGMPEGADPGLAFVLVQHLAPDYKSMLTALIQRYTRMQVFEVVDGMTVQPNCAYVIPPGRDMAFRDGRLKLTEPSAPRGQRLPIDFFFRSLAQDQRELAICIVLSGTGCDGALGVRAIKAEGGMVMVQTPDSAEFDGMPCSAIATGLVDYELPPAEMPTQLMAHTASIFYNPDDVKAFEEHLLVSTDSTFKLYNRQTAINNTKRKDLDWDIPPSAAIEKMAPNAVGKTAITGKMSLRELTEQALLRQVAPTGALVNGKGEVLYLHGRTGMYLEPAPGEVGVNNILDMAREGLQLALTTALHQAVEKKEIARRSGLLVKNHSGFTAVNLTVCPLASRPEPACKEQYRNGEGAGSTAPMLFLVIMEEALVFNPIHLSETKFLDADEEMAGSGSSVARENARIVTLRQELWAKEEYLQTANEELKSTNEELQSTNEELETSREEMQSTNEELFTVNAALQIKVFDLSSKNNDLNNLLAGTGIATIFLDNDLRILRFTPNAVELINLIPRDLGRPLSHIASNMVGYDRLAEDARVVLDTLIPHEIEVQSSMGRWYMLRILPYRTLDEVIEGIVLTFVDHTESKCVGGNL